MRRLVMPDGWQICTNGRKVPTVVGDFGLVVFGVWLFGFRVCDISGISHIAHCDLALGPHDFGFFLGGGDLMILIW